MTRLTRAALLLCLVVVAVVVTVLGARAVVDIARGLRALGGAGAAEEPGGPVGGTDARGGDARGSDAAGIGRAAPGPPPGVPGDAQPAVVDRVVDRDTIRVHIGEPGGPIPPTEVIGVRLLNVDAPELDHPRRGRDCGAPEATALVAELVPPGTRVWLVTDTEDRDRYDRPLRAVFTSGGRFVNAELTRAGWAEAVLFAPNDRFHERLAELADQARERGRGAWAACGGFP